jgi:hypothetical protein
LPPRLFRFARPFAVRAEGGNSEKGSRTHLAVIFWITQFFAYLYQKEAVWPLNRRWRAVCAAPAEIRTIFRAMTRTAPTPRLRARRGRRARLTGINRIETEPH